MGFHAQIGRLLLILSGAPRMTMRRRDLVIPAATIQKAADHSGTFLPLWSVICRISDTHLFIITVEIKGAGWICPPWQFSLREVCLICRDAV